jgi:hypothetical protein
MMVLSVTTCEGNWLPLPMNAVFTLCISQDQTRYILPLLAQQTLVAHPHYFTEIEVTLPVGELVSN